MKFKIIFLFSLANSQLQIEEEILPPVTQFFETVESTPYVGPLYHREYMRDIK